MKFEEVIKLLNISEATLHNYCKKGMITKFKLDNGRNDYNDDDIKKILDDRKKILDDKIIVLIDPKKETIDKTYNNINEVVDDLKITQNLVQSCLNHKANTGGNYIIKYKKD